MRSKQRSEKRRQRFSEGLPQVASKQQELFTTSTAPSQGTTRLEIVGQIPTDKTCISCAVPLTKDNWWPSFVMKKHYKCINCYDIRRTENSIKRGNRSPSLLAKLFGLKAKDVYDQVTEGSVYVIANKAWDGWVKVGMAIDAEDRLKSYQTSSPFRDYMLYYSYTTSNRRKSEAEAHSMLEQKYERRNEWFLCTPSQAIEVLNGQVNR
jgi:hypothetical protein